MIAAVYCRKSTEQSGVSDDQKSVARQIEHARAYAIRKGWTVDDAHVYVDDGISGAEFANRPGFLRLMNALKPRAPFQVLVMSEESRLGRESIEVSYALKTLVQAGVRVWLYMEDRERTLDSPTDKIMLSLTTFADELEREKARQRTYDAMLRKAKAGHVTGGACYGYRNIEISDASGNRSHVERQINETEAAVIRQICAVRRGPRREGHHEDPERGGGAVPAGATRASADLGADVRAGGALSGGLPRHDRLEQNTQAQPVGHPEAGGAAGGGRAQHSGARLADRVGGCLGGSTRAHGAGDLRARHGGRHSAGRRSGIRRNTC